MIKATLVYKCLYCEAIDKVRKDFASTNDAIGALRPTFNQYITDVCVHECENSGIESNGIGVMLLVGIEYDKPYPMTKDRKEIQLDCRKTACRYYDSGDCTCNAPAITLNQNKEFVCWSEKDK